MDNINWLGNKVVDSHSYLVPQSLMDQYSNTKSDQSVPTISSIPTQTTPGQTPQTQQTPAQQPMQQTPLPVTLQGPPPSTEPGYIPYFLSQNIGRYVRAEFIIGNDEYVDKTGRIKEVGINYFVLDDVNAQTLVMCDLYSVKFVTILPETQVPR